MNAYFFERLRVTLKFGGGAGTAIATSAALASDFFLPLAPFGLYVGIACILVTLLSLAIRFSPRVNQAVKNLVGDVWFLPVFTFLLVVAVASLGAYKLSSSAGDRGFLAANLQDIGALQTQLLSLERLVESSEKTADGVQILVDNDNRRMADLRQELSRLGIPYTKDAYLQAMIESNAEILALFSQTNLVQCVLGGPGL